MQYLAPIRFHPQRWVGFCLAYSKDLIEFIKILPCAAWDKVAKTWWVPEGSEALVRAEARRLGLLHNQVDHQWLKKLNAGTNPYASDLAQEYAKLMLTPEAPRALIEIVYLWWKRQLETSGGTFVQQHEIHEAYKAITEAPTNEVKSDA